MTVELASPRTPRGRAVGCKFVDKPDRRYRWIHDHAGRYPWELVIKYPNVKREDLRPRSRLECASRSDAVLLAAMHGEVTLDELTRVARAIMEQTVVYGQSELMDEVKVEDIIDLLRETLPMAKGFVFNIAFMTGETSWSLTRLVVCLVSEAIAMMYVQQALHSLLLQVVRLDEKRLAEARAKLLAVAKAVVKTVVNTSVHVKLICSCETDAEKVLPSTPEFRRRLHAVIQDFAEEQADELYTIIRMVVEGKLKREDMPLDCFAEFREHLTERVRKFVLAEHPSFLDDYTVLLTPKPFSKT